MDNMDEIKGKVEDLPESITYFMLCYRYKSSDVWYSGMITQTREAAMQMGGGDAIRNRRLVTITLPI